MKQLLDNRSGEVIEPKTLFSYTVNNSLLCFYFEAFDSSLNSFSDIDNDKLYCGDVVEVFLDLGDDFYYEFEVAPNGTCFVAKIVDRTPVFIDRHFFKCSSVINGNIYKVKMEINLSKVTHKDVIKFNAFRIETKGIKRDLILQALNPTLSDTFHNKNKFINLIHK